MIILFSFSVSFLSLSDNRYLYFSYFFDIKHAICKLNFTKCNKKRPYDNKSVAWGTKIFARYHPSSAIINRPSLRLFREPTPESSEPFSVLKMQEAIAVLSGIRWATFKILATDSHHPSALFRPKRSLLLPKRKNPNNKCILPQSL